MSRRNRRHTVRAPGGGSTRSGQPNQALPDLAGPRNRTLTHTAPLNARASRKESSPKRDTGPELVPLDKLPRTAHLAGDLGTFTHRHDFSGIGGALESVERLALGLHATARELAADARRLRRLLLLALVMLAASSCGAAPREAGAPCQPGAGSWCSDDGRAVLVCLEGRWYSQGKDTAHQLCGCAELDAGVAALFCEAQP